MSQSGASIRKMYVRYCETGSVDCMLPVYRNNMSRSVRLIDPTMSFAK